MEVSHSFDTTATAAFRGLSTSVDGQLALPMEESARTFSDFEGKVMGALMSMGLAILQPVMSIVSLRSLDGLVCPPIPSWN